MTIVCQQLASLKDLVKVMQVSNLQNTPIFCHLPGRNEVCFKSWEDHMLYHPSPWLLLVEGRIHLALSLHEEQIVIELNYSGVRRV